jgi:hypothetical protein
MANFLKSTRNTELSKSSQFYMILHLVARYKADVYSSVGTYIATWHGTFNVIESNFINK